MVETVGLESEILMLCRLDWWLWNHLRAQVDVGSNVYTARLLLTSLVTRFAKHVGHAAPK
jgi:hypothetical protein